MTLRPFLIFSITLIFSAPAISQQLFEEKIYTGTQDSFLFKSDYVIFDENGNYCFESTIDEQEYYITRDKKIGPLKSIHSTFSSNGDFSQSYQYDGSKDQNWYCRNFYSTKIFGPFKGEPDDEKANDNGSLIAFIAKYKDSSICFINDRKVFGVGPKEAIHLVRDWCFLSPNTNDFIYLQYQKGITYLFHNFKPIDTSFAFENIQFNERGDYAYSKTLKNSSEYDIVVNGKVTLRDVPYHKLKLLSDGNFYCSAGNKIYTKDSIFALPDDEESEYGRFSIYQSKIIFGGKPNSFLATIPAKDGYNVIVNGRLEGNYKDVFYPVMDSAGNYAYFALKNYYLYPVLNGKELPALSKYNVRAKPLFIHPDGTIYCYYKTNDSIYIYKNDQLLFSFRKNQKFKYQPASDLFHYREKEHSLSRVYFIEIDSTIYFLQNGNLSGAYQDTSNPEITTFIKGNETDNGDYYFIQNLGNKQFQLTYNGVKYPPVSNVDRVLRYNDKMNEKGVVFYVQRGNEIYKYSTYGK